ncbi:helix-turn-helix transcriptional regulator [Pectobacterium sp. FL60-S17]|uniref:Helix-turn-helix transcriptional regulator n=1 Tax=Pectobacterium brasiliense TaxID=180957 RepID=A0AAE3BGK5_9GAMM|nr:MULTISPECIES: XRE family transcriptional regulator [Pectobacterium]MBE5201157.1 helix-turn-helix transcriptional regulator [Pectobacterium quasiaquaticum]MBE5211610.1 helix-turn-helix transcriptional regulator [Pectobacterium quasiaquaticum]MBN3053618.1 helix-turn-helix transcriptional regulator [Pectobacterium brasiliense]MCH5050886.1 helix-turn-helix transcriptional regulator [Pectobacterium aquaticum]UEM39466.1 XRE family transcriptional regulator [Pectobacterium aquaticum]
MSDELTRRIGNTLKTLRQEKGWSLTRAAEETGVSKAMLGQIERGESSPTVATLWKIATGMNVAFSTFIEPTLADEDVTYRSGVGSTFRGDEVGMHVVPLFPFDEKLRFDMLVIELAAGASSTSSAHESGVIEHIIVLEGQLEMTVDGQTHVLSAGDALRFTADREHRYHNPADTTARFHNLIHYPDKK